MTDQELLVSTLRDAGRIIGEYLNPGQRDAEQTLSRLLDTQDVARAIERLEKCHGLGVMK